MNTFSLIDMVYKYILMKMFDSAFECYESNYLQSMPSSMEKNACLIYFHKIIINFGKDSVVRQSWVSL